MSTDLESSFYIPHKLQYFSLLSAHQGVFHGLLANESLLNQDCYCKLKLLTIVVVY